MNGFNNLIQDYVNQPKPNYTQAQVPFINNLKANLNNAVQNGLEPEKIVRMTGIMTLLIEKGITVDDFQHHQQLFVILCIQSDFSVMDHNINYIFNQMNIARNA